MNENQLLKELLKKRLDDAVEDIFEIFERTVAEYEEQIRRQRRTLESVLSPTVSLQRTVLGPEHVLQKKATEESAPYSPDFCDALESSDSEQTDHSSDYNPDYNQDYSPDQDQDYSSNLPPKPATPDLGPDVSQDPASYSCSVCDQSFSTHSLLTDHLTSHTSGDITDQHMKIHSEEKPFSCPVCNKGFIKNSSFQKHLKTCKKADPQIKILFEEKDCSCSVCNKTITFSGRLQLTNHLMTHIDAETGKCLACDKIISKQEQRRHMMIHSGEKPFSCSVCNKRFIKRYSRERHQATCKGQKTVVKQTPDERGSISRDKNINKRNIRRHAGERCYICGRSFLKKIALKNHLKICTKKTKTPREDGTEKKNFTCSLCKETFAKNSKLTDHMTTHRDAETGKCLVCDVIIDEYHVRRHMMMHSGEKPLSCPVCTKIYARKAGLRKHLKTCKKMNVLMELNSEEQVNFSCSVCNESVDNNLLLAVHMTAHAAEMDLGCNKNLDKNEAQLDIIPQKKPNQNLCSVCGKVFSTKTNLKKHMFIHTGVRPFSCTVCGQTFRQNFDKKRHMMIHTGEKPFTCKICNKGFLRRVHMRRHMSVHVQNGTLSREMLEQEDAIICNNYGSGFNRDLHFKRHLKKCQEFGNDHSSHQLTYSCSVCAETFAAREALADHLTTHKSGARVNCAVCGKTFPSVEMKHHFRSHSKERRFICEVCGKGFKRSDHLKGHLEIHNKDRTLTKPRLKERKKRTLTRSRDRTVECEICGKEFIRKTQLKLHLKTHRKEEHAAVQSLMSEQETYTCPDCAFPCVTYSHQDTSKRQLHCPSCRRSFSTETGLDQDRNRTKPGLDQD